MSISVAYQHGTGFSAGAVGGNDAAVVLPADNAPLCDSQRLWLRGVDVVVSATLSVVWQIAERKECRARRRRRSQTPRVRVFHHPKRHHHICAVQCRGQHR